MRIAVNTLAVIPGITASAERYTSSLVSSLLQVDDQNEYVLILRKDNQHIFPEKGDRLVRVVSPLGNGSRALRVLWEQAYLPVLCRLHTIDLLLVPTGVGPIWVPCPSVIVVTLMLAFRMPEVLSWQKRLYYQWCHGLSLRRATRVVALSEQGRQDVQRYLGLDPAKIDVVHAGVSEEFRRGCEGVEPTSIPEVGHRQEYVLAVGPVQAYKNLDLLVRAFAKVRAQGFPHRLVIASGGQTIPFSLKRLAGEVGLNDGITFVERFLTKEELVALYSGATVFVHPSSEEQFSLTVLEAMSCGAPVITSNLPSFQEQAGEAGIVVPVGNEAALSDGIVAVLSDPARQQAMTIRSLERSRQFSWAVAARKMIAIFSDVINEK
jgi:glycosyltransferase involved in cell wall biosynthesis